MVKDLLSAAVVDYNNGPLLYETLQSIIAQDYPSIEIIVSNDGSPDFDAPAVERWLGEHAGPNIKSYTVCKQPKNLGLAGNAEWCRTHAQGEFFAAIAGDDAYADPHVFSAGIEKLKSEGEEAYIVLGTVVMCGDTLDVVYGETNPETVRLIKETLPEDVWKINIPRFPIPLCTVCYRMSMFDKIGGYDTRYKQMEDWPLMQRISRAGIRLYWLDGPKNLCHRNGGLSQGGERAGKAACKALACDMLLFYKLEIRPYRAMLSADDKRYIDKLRVQWWLAADGDFGEGWQRACMAPVWGVCRAWQAFRKHAGYVLHRYLLRDKYR